MLLIAGFLSGRGGLVAVHRGLSTVSGRGCRVSLLDCGFPVKLSSLSSTVCGCWVLPLLQLGVLWA
ncbi:hypothetical protein DM860_017001 [Cuscuta australis]|uniref:Uncharacterized protein n=1 Tax=Cuscuta australis TaxID=267555 RepID=A0A328DNY6_9ASTE|nr:hypothetical protein DM860_017001 [Cuscuta australis]